VLAMGIMAHELARQSMESGALSGASGQVNIAWQCDETADGPSLVWSWKETGNSQEIASLDTSLVQLCAEHELQGFASIADGPDGRRITVTAKLQSIGGEADA
jgi:two-component sensor histidine kinase